MSVCVCVFLRLPTFPFFLVVSCVGFLLFGGVGGERQAKRKTTTLGVPHFSRAQALTFVTVEPKLAKCDLAHVAMLKAKHPRVRLAASKQTSRKAFCGLDL